MQVGQRRHGKPRGTQLGEGVDPERAEGQQAARAQHPVPLGDRGRDVVEPVEGQVRPDEVDRAGGQRQSVGVADQVAGERADAGVGAAAGQAPDQAGRPAAADRPVERGGTRDATRREVHADRLGLRPAAAEPARAVAQAAADVEHPGRYELHQFQALEHPALDLAQQEVGGVGRGGAAVELATHRRTI